MPMLAYGEDALTLHALTAGIDGLFRQLNDPTDPADAIRFFRPSFGRRASSVGKPSRAEFGEFDAIIGTSFAVYLLEAKWSASSEFGGSNLELRPEQTRRHAAFRVYLDQWRAYGGDDWTTFSERVRVPLSERTGLIPPNAGSILGRNLKYVLTQLQSCGTQIRDVLLFTRMSLDSPVPQACGEFCVITHTCQPEEGARFILLDQ